MADPYVGEIRLFTGNYAPRDWAFCDGSLLTVANYSTLFAVIGNQYGGDGKVNFALPNLNNRAPIGQGQGQGLTNRVFAQAIGTPTETLIESQIPNHTHIAQAIASPGTENGPGENYWAETSKEGRPPVQQPIYDGTPNIPMNVQAINSVGGGQAHNNMQPYLAVSFIISLAGVYPLKK